MDQELIAYFDRRFQETSQQIREEIASLRQETTQQIASLREETIQRFEKVDQRFDKVDQRFEKVDQRFEKVDQRFEKADERFQGLEETVGYTKILVEDLRDQIKQVAEGVVGVNQRLDAFKEEVREEFKDVRSFFTAHNKNLESRVQILEGKAARPRRSTPRTS